MAIQKRIDNYGQDWTSVEYRKFKKDIIQTDKASDTVEYVRFDNTAEACAIWKISKDNGITTIMWAWGLWANRASLTYEKSLNEDIYINIA